jgi:hypothetical protein
MPLVGFDHPNPARLSRHAIRGRNRLNTHPTDLRTQQGQAFPAALILFLLGALSLRGFAVWLKSGDAREAVLGIGFAVAVGGIRGAVRHREGARRRHRSPRGIIIVRVGHAESVRTLRVHLCPSPHADPSSDRLHVVEESVVGSLAHLWLPRSKYTWPTRSKFPFQDWFSAASFFRFGSRPLGVLSPLLRLWPNRTELRWRGCCRRSPWLAFGMECCASTALGDLDT